MCVVYYIVHILCLPLVGVLYNILCSISVCCATQPVYYIVGVCSVLYYVPLVGVPLFSHLAVETSQASGPSPNHWQNSNCFFYSQWKTTNNAIVSFGDFTWDLHKPNGGPAPLAWSS